MAKCHEHQKYQEGKGGISCKEKVGLGKDSQDHFFVPIILCAGSFSRCFFPTFVRPSVSAGIRRPVVPDAWWFPAHRQQSFVATKRPHGTAQISAIATKWKSVREEVPQNVQAARMIVSVLKCRTSKQHWSKIRRWTPVCTSASWKRSRCLASREQRASRRTSGQCKLCSHSTAPIFEDVFARRLFLWFLSDTLVTKARETANCCKCWMIFNSSSLSGDAWFESICCGIPIGTARAAAGFQREAGDPSIAMMDNSLYSHCNESVCFKSMLIRHFDQENTPPWSRQIFEPKLIPVFFILPKKQSFQGRRCLGHGTCWDWRRAWEYIVVSNPGFSVRKRDIGRNPGTAPRNS